MGDAQADMTPMNCFGSEIRFALGDKEWPLVERVHTFGRRVAIASQTAGTLMWVLAASDVRTSQISAQIVLTGVVLSFLLGALTYRISQATTVFRFGPGILLPALAVAAIAEALVLVTLVAYRGPRGPFSSPEAAYITAGLVMLTAIPLLIYSIRARPVFRRISTRLQAEASTCGV